MKTEEKLQLLFDYQKFENEPHLAQVIADAELNGQALNEESLDSVNAAGEGGKPASWQEGDKILLFGQNGEILIPGKENKER